MQLAQPDEADRMLVQPMVAETQPQCGETVRIFRDAVSIGRAARKLVRGEVARDANECDHSPWLSHPWIGEVIREMSSSGAYVCPRVVK